MKKFIIFPLIALALSIVLLPPNTAAQNSQSADVLLGAALHQEEVEGNLEAAIETYKKLLAEFPGNRPLAAKAQLHLGFCYEKLGAANAEDAYRKVIAEFADQPEAVSAARERLNSLRKSSLPTGGEDALTIRRVSYPQGVISPDGKYIAHEDW
ncbi:MAG: tetratricopeptide repeat protein, partial [Candidatus Aminicenantes bacterium]|nr:tetratricopeptide repeat protein [Candidatus Aminicenantes bacterium]